MKYNRICQIPVSKNLLYKAHCPGLPMQDWLQP